MRFKTLLFFFFLLFSAKVFSQGVKVAVFQEEQGLPNNFTKAIIEDDQGFTWIGSDRGVWRHDGKHFNTYERSISNIKSFFKTRKGTLFVIHDNGITEIINRIDTVLFKTFLDAKYEMTDTTLHYPKAVYEDASSNIWISEPSSIVKVKDGKLKRYKFGEKYATSSFLRSFSFAEDGIGNTIIASQQGFLFYYDAKKDSICELKLQHPLVSVNALINAEKGKIWICSANGITEMMLSEDKKSADMNTIVKQPREISCILKDKDGSYYFGTWNAGFYKATYNNQNELEVNKIEKLKFRAINAIYTSKHNQLIISGDEGIAFVGKTQFDKLNIDISREYIQCLIKGKDNTLYMTDGSAVYEIKPSRKDFESKNILQAQDEDFLSLAWSDNALWVGTNKGALIQYKNKKIARRIELNQKVGTTIFYMSADTKGNIWFCHDAEDVMKITPDFKQVGYNVRKGILTKTLVVKQLNDGNIYCGAYGRNTCLYKYNSKTDIFENISPEIADQAANNFAVNDLCIDSKGVMWLASNYGLYKVDGKKGVKETLYNIADNREIEIIHAIEPSNKGLWVGTGSGLLRFNKSNEYILYDHLSGLPTKTLSFRSLLLLPNGIFAGTANGVAYSALSLKADYTQQPVFLDLKVNGQLVNFKTDSIYHFKDNSFLQAEVLSICFPGDKISYQYRLVGKSDGWSMPNRTSEITLPQLKKGEYTLEVRALDQSGFYWSAPLKLKFTISESPYTSWIAILIYIFFSTAVILGGVKIYTSHLVKEKERLEKIVEERTAKVNRQKEEIVKQKEELEFQKNNIEEKSDKLEHAYQDIQDSMQYAKTIQDAMLRSVALAYQYFDDLFVLHKPRDIVSGDFYWYANRNGKAVIAAVDCTGHGVPGALMSMIGNTVLNNVVNEKGITSPDQILTELNRGIRAILRPDKTGSRDGMDIAICMIDKQNKILEYSGAFNPLYIIQNNELKHVKGNIISIGGASKKDDVEYTKHTFDLSIPTTFYLFSDGFQDQIGGPENIKFMRTPFRDLLFSIHKKTMEEQKKILEDTLANWKGNRDQIDDILVIGGRIDPSL